MALGLNNDPNDLSRKMGGFVAAREFGDKFPNVDGFFQSREKQPGVQNASMSASPEADKLTLREETLLAREKNRGVFDDEANPDHEKLLLYKSGSVIVGGNRTDDKDEEKRAEEKREKEAYTRRQFLEMVNQAQARYNALSEIAQQASEDHRLAFQELQQARQELAVAESRASEAAGQVEAHQQDIADATEERREAVAAVEGQTVTIDGQVIRYDSDFNDFRDQNGNTVDPAILEQSDDPAAQKFLAARESKYSEISSMYGGRHTDYQANQTEQDLLKEQQEFEEAARLEAEAKVEAERTAAEAEVARQDYEALKEQEESLNASAPASEEVTDSSLRTTSAVGETGLIEEAKVKAPNISGMYNASAAGVPETSDVSSEQNLAQTADMAATSNPVVRSQFSAMP